MRIKGDGRRKTIIVDRSFQYRATVVGLLYIIAAAAVISLPLMSVMRSTDLLLQGRSAELISLYRNQQTHTILALSVFFVGLLVAWTLFTLWRTHKIAGPIVKMTRYIHRMALGNFSERIRLRTGDELQALAEALNDMSISLEKRDGLIRDQILREIQSVRDALHSNPSADGTQAIDRISAAVGDTFERHSETHGDVDKADDLVYT